MTTRPDASGVARYGYDPRNRRYRDRLNGRYVSAQDVRGAVDTVIDTETVKIRSLSQSLVDGKISLAEWQVQMASQLKGLHVALGLAANGGLANTSAADLGYLASLMKKQYQFLRDFALQIRRGEQPLDGTLVARAALYTQAARGTYEDMVGRAAQHGGAHEERSMLGPADHCKGCIAEAAKRWSPIGSLIPIGERQCLANCRCTMQYR
jgi:hypothetical protein